MTPSLFVDGSDLTYAGVRDLARSKGLTAFMDAGGFLCLIQGRLRRFPSFEAWAAYIAAYEPSRGQES